MDIISAWGVNSGSPQRRTTTDPKMYVKDLTVEGALGQKLASHRLAKAWMGTRMKQGYRGENGFKLFLKNFW